ncbi:MAG TPA: UrcA family protein [Steroidobacteraceae bacterium]|nr:UrcA family protein [Steroidobacteraceae bacterium]
MIRHTSTQTRGRARAAVAAVAGCLFVAAMGAASAAPSDSPPTVRVSYADLDLSTEQGVRTLYARIVTAADQVCPYATMDNLILYMKSRACRKQAITEAVAHVGNPRLAAVSAEHTAHG